MLAQAAALADTLRVQPIHQTIPPELQAGWLDMLGSPDALPFIRPEWFAALCNAHLRRRWFVLTLEQQERLAALLPIEQRTPWTAEIAAPMSPATGPLLLAADAEEAFWQALAAWLRRGPIAMLGLGRYDTARMQHLTALAGAHGLTPIIHTVGPVVWVSLPRTWEEYLQRLSGSHRYKVRHAESEIQRDFPAAEYAISTDLAECLPAIDDVIRLNCLRFAGEKARSYLADPQMADFYRQAMRWIIAQGYGAMCTLRIRQQTVAVVGAIHLPGHANAYYHMVGRDPQAIPNNYSPGFALACHVIRWAMARGAQALCLGQGSLPYKYHLGGVDTVLHEVQIARSPLAGAILGKVDPALRRLNLALDAYLYQCRAA